MIADITRETIVAESIFFNQFFSEPFIGVFKSSISKNFKVFQVNLFCSVSMLGLQKFVQKTCESEHSEAATGGVLWKKVMLEISQNSQENTCAGVSLLIKVQAWGFWAFQSDHL